MSGKVLVQSVEERLRAGKGNLCCNDVKGLLEEVGFEVRDGKRGGHKVFTHSGLAEFKSGSFNCGHGKNPEIKAAYIGKVLRVIEIHRPALIAYLDR